MSAALIHMHLKVSNGAKIRNRYNQVPHLTSFIMEANTMNPDQRSRLKWVHIVIEATKVHQQIKNQPIFEPLHDISKNVVCETREGSD